MKFLSKLYRFSSSWTGTIIIVAFVIFFIAQAFVIPTRSMVGTLYEGDMLFVKKFSYGIPIPRIPWIEIPVFPDLKGNGHIIEGERPKRGDVVVFIPPHEEKTYYVKRNFAIGGDEVIWSAQGFFLRPKEGDEGIKKYFPHAQVQEFFGKKFIKNPYMQNHLGIAYHSHNARFQEAVNALSFDEENWAIAGTCQNEKTKEIYECKQEFSMIPIGRDGRRIEGSTLYTHSDVVFYKKIADDEFFMIGDNRDNSLDSRYWGSVPYAQIIGTPWVVYFSINLSNSQEAQEEAQRLGKEDGWWKYTIRWNRVFKSLNSLEEDLRSKNVGN
ncbi:signal peptidase I [Helicobacter pametensis]|uniref:signal peptidase I n=1 Tax=Helicobacter pametensis TaxID=95149 RepID=UPI000484B5CB|nr:signal peptidase I [Helicobacter pametensis]